uniref:Uncharacterized protein n=1 Tax=viral metagenome TaxID=1070528 RepID=A0A6C0BN16_9ZZZZ
MEAIQTRVQDAFGNYRTAAIITIIVLIIALIVLFFRTVGNNWFLWLIIIIGIVVLIFLSRNLWSNLRDAVLGPIGNITNARTA